MIHHPGLIGHEVMAVPVGSLMRIEKIGSSHSLVEGCAPIEIGILGVEVGIAPVGAGIDEPVLLTC